MSELAHRLDRNVVIRARPETVFQFFTNNEYWAKWWGAGSTIDAQPGGKVLILHPNGAESSGEVLEVHPIDRIVFTYGFASGKPMPPGSSRVTIDLEPDDDGTRLHLRHDFAETQARDQHVQGWRFQLSLFANAVADVAYANAAEIVDAWYRAWTITDDQERKDAFAKIVAPNIQFRDRHSMLDGLNELSAHAGAALRYSPSVGLERIGKVRHCQGSVLADWSAKGPDGKERVSGSSVLVLRPDGKIKDATGFTNP